MKKQLTEDEREERYYDRLKTRRVRHQRRLLFFIVVAALVMVGLLLTYAK